MFLRGMPKDSTSMMVQWSADRKLEVVWPGPLRPDQTPGLSDAGFEPLWSQPGRAPCAYLRDRGLESVDLKRDDFSSNRHPALSFCLSMISGQTLRVCPEGKP